MVSVNDLATAAAASSRRAGRPAPRTAAGARARSAAAPRAPRSPSPSWRISRRAAPLRRHRDHRRRGGRAATDRRRIGSVFRACMFIGSDLRVRWAGRTRRAARLDQTSTRLMDRDFRYAVGFSGSNTLPSKKVSLPREVEVGMSAAATPSSLAASLPEVLAVDLGDQRLGVVARRRTCPSGCPRSGTRGRGSGTDRRHGRSRTASGAGCSRRPCRCRSRTCP